ncbi:MAG TPA: hypothetical protein VG939_10385 [Caulobacteraceae bacterium]|nr:hypothetical protein [Caulobacteraceae bacterium]
MGQATVDYGGTAAPNRTRRTFVAVAAVGALASLAFLVYASLKDRAINVAEATAESSAWKIAGPPCPGLTAADYRTQGLSADKTFDFNGLTYSRRFGNAFCSEVATKGLMGAASYPACQFTSPDVLAVKRGRDLFLFRPGLGRKATVTVRDGRVACVMAAPYWD